MLADAPPIEELIEDVVSSAVTFLLGHNIRFDYS